MFCFMLLKNVQLVFWAGQYCYYLSSLRRTLVHFYQYWARHQTTCRAVKRLTVHNPFVIYGTGFSVLQMSVNR